ncbi:hypothetical protein H6G06_14670 [Anabaena sphaerica FACHB-251]|uniref:Uncharacterized protein n=1 Tax=Anabaena sphaerica FACHB-251 TaxID=2692883 RepID=A0A926WIZ2_9NOST|nr:hypothetical protein [Anabaena sphaerica]MBD2294689.1 hypothetical protein [Anabaena sphaerica FACHB-251]
MSTHTATATDIERSQVFDEFRKCMQIQYNGKLTVVSPKGHNWSFYYRLGQIVWATDGTHPYRRLRRYVTQNCPQIDPNKIQLSPPESISIDYADYCWLKTLYKNQQIKREQINEIVVHTIVEMLFDLAQNVNLFSLNWELDQKVILEAPIMSTSAIMSIEHMEKRWNHVSEAWLASVYPHLKPIFYKLDHSSEIYLIGRFLIKIFD